ncbi:MAG: primase-helicase zinc-binding domain-containing protein [Butyricicoccaceae bacterium]
MPPQRSEPCFRCKRNDRFVFRLSQNRGGVICQENGCIAPKIDTF